MSGATIYSDGDSRRISWAIQTKRHTLRERRVQARVYRGRVSKMQAKFMALHVGLFWGIGVFAIQNGDAVRFMVDDHSMMFSATSGHSGDSFIDSRIRFVNMLARQRNLDVSFAYVDPGDNPARL